MKIMPCKKNLTGVYFYYDIDNEMAVFYDKYLRENVFTKFPAKEFLEQLYIGWISIIDNDLLFPVNTRESAYYYRKCEKK